MYQALYRKYRPQTFDDMVGQLAVTQTLKTQLQRSNPFAIWSPESNLTWPHYHPLTFEMCLFKKEKRKEHK